MPSSASSPRKGLAVARMAAHITYMSDEALHRKFGRQLQDRTKLTFGFDADFQVESYLRHQGTAFVDRFDANSYLYMTRAMDYFDLALDYGGVLANAFRGTQDALLRRLLHLRLAVPDAGEPHHRARAERRGGERLLRRDRDRPRPRRLPARRAGAVRHRLRLPLRRRAPPGRQMTAMQNRITAAHPERADLKIIAGFVTPGARVLDVGCGDGALLMRLEEEKQADGRGIELSQKGVNEAVARGLSVVQGDADHDLATYPDDAFDFVILSQTLQATTIRASCWSSSCASAERSSCRSRISATGASARQFLLNGRMPITEDLPYSWYDTPNIHFCTVRDFMQLVRGGRRAGREGGGALRQRPRAEPLRPPAAVEFPGRPGDLSAFTAVKAFSRSRRPVGRAPGEAPG